MVSASYAVRLAAALAVGARTADGETRTTDAGDAGDAGAGERNATTAGDAAGLLREDRSRPPYIVPLAWLGCQVEVREFACSRWRCMSEDVFELVRLEPTCGGEPLCQVVLSDDMFAADAMLGEAVSFEEMKVRALKEELAELGASRTGAKHVLQQRLHTLIVQEAARRVRVRADEEADLDG